MEAMAILLGISLLFAQPAPPPLEVDQLAKLLRAKETAKALTLLKRIGTLEHNDAEAKALVKLIRNRRIPKPPAVLEACFLALKGIKSRKVTRDLKALRKLNPLRKDPAVRIGICRALQGSADPAGAETIRALLRDPVDAVVAAAAEAAGAYRTAKQSIRKELFKTLVDIYVGTWNLKNSVQPDLKTEMRRAERKWERIRKPMEKSMQLLSNVTRNDPPAWRRWWNKNKHKRWGELEE